MGGKQSNRGFHMEQNDRISRYLAYAYQSYRHYIADTVRSLDMGLSDYAPMLYLYHHETRARDGVTQTELAQNTGHDKAAIARSMRKLADIGYVTVERNEANRSANLVRPTRAGLAAARKVDAKAREWEDVVWGAMGDGAKEPFMASARDAYEKLSGDIGGGRDE